MLKSSSPEELKKQIEWLKKLIKTRFITKEGFLARHHPSSNRTLFDNFDDIVPFFIYFGEKDFLLNQIRLIKRYHQDFFSLCSDRGVLIARDIDEWFGGLYALWKETKDPETFFILKKSLESLKGKIIIKNYLSAAYYLHNKTSVKFYESWSFGLLETFVEMRDDFPEYYDYAKKVMRNVVLGDYFKKYGLFPYRIYASRTKNFFQKTVSSHLEPYPSYSKAPFAAKTGFASGLKNKIRLADLAWRNGWYSQLMKSNSTPAFTLIELCRATGDNFWAKKLDVWVKSALINFCTEGKVYQEYIPVINLKRHSGLAPTFILSDVICDASFFYPNFKKYLSKVKKIIDHQWRQRNSSGLIPEYEKGDKVHLDNQIDFSISLRRFAEVADDKNYKEKSKELLFSAFKQHRTEDGFMTYSGVNGGSLRKIIDPKYNALALKGYTSLLTMDEKLYPKYYSLFKDR